jgi:hypothetical protein
MFSTIIAKFAPLLLVLCVGGVGGMFLQHKVFSDPPVVVPDCPACPACNCPQPTVSVQPFDVEKIKGLKEFNYSPQYTGNISVNGVDSASVRKWIENSIAKAIDKHTPPKEEKKKRKLF